MAKIVYIIIYNKYETEIDQEMNLVANCLSVFQEHRKRIAVIFELFFIFLYFKSNKLLEHLEIAE